MVAASRKMAEGTPFQCRFTEAANVAVYPSTGHHRHMQLPLRSFPQAVQKVLQRTGRVSIRSLPIRQCPSARAQQKAVACPTPGIRPR